MRKAKSKPPTEAEMRDYLWAGGWLMSNRGWWHPPSCLASWPINEAYESALRDEASGLRMTPEEVKEYLDGR